MSNLMKRVLIMGLAVAAMAALSLAPADGYARGHYYGVAHGQGAGCTKADHAEHQDEGTESHASHLATDS